eukprot:g1875.t1
MHGNALGSIGDTDTAGIDETGRHNSVTTGNDNIETIDAADGVGIGINGMEAIGAADGAGERAHVHDESKDDPASTGVPAVPNRRITRSMSRSASPDAQTADLPELRDVSGFTRLGADFSVFWRESDDCILAIYTDDVVATGPDDAVVDRVMDEIRNEGLEFTVSENFKDVLGVVIDLADDGRRRGLLADAPALRRHRVATGRFADEAWERRQPGDVRRPPQRRRNVPSNQAIVSRN